MLKQSLIGGLVATGALLAPVVGSAATITGWDTSNVSVPDSNPPDGETGFSEVYDGDPDDPDSSTYGRIAFTPPEASLPGIKIEGGTPENEGDPAVFPYTGTKNQDFDGCIMTSSEAYCDSEFQSGKRIKEQITGIGPIDLVFGVEVNPNEGDDSSLYQVFHRLINVSETDLTGFALELGTGVGDSFVASTDGDGLKFATLNLEGDPLKFGPDNLTSFSQYPFGLFGGEPLNPNPLELKGFFDIGDPDDPDNNGRAGFELTQTEDKIQSGAFYGTYDDLFNFWLSQEDVPEGLFWDYALGEADPLLMAWLNPDGEWEIRRDIAEGVLNPDGTWDPFSIGAGDVLSLAMDDWETVGTIAEVLTFLGLNDMLDGPIEDLANLNVTFGIEISNLFASQNESFTFRVTPTPVPLPAGAPLLIGGLMAMGLVARRRKNAQSTA
jgi:hypothetical protein